MTTEEKRASRRSHKPSSPDRVAKVEEATDGSSETEKIVLKGFPSSRRWKTPATPYPSKQDMQSSYRFGLAETLEVEAILTRNDDDDDDLALQDEELVGNSFDLFHSRPRAKDRSFNAILRFAALLDLLSHVAPTILCRPDDEKDEKDFIYQYLKRFFVNRAAEQVTNRGVLQVFLTFCAEKRNELGLLFSLLWFTNSLSHASRIRSWVSTQRQKKELFSRNNDGDGVGDLGNKSEKDGSGANLGSTATTIDRIGGPWGLYFIIIGFQILTLPIGFYKLIYNSIHVEVGSILNAAGTFDNIKTQIISIAGEDIISLKYQQSALYVGFTQLLYFASQRLKEEVMANLILKRKRLLRYLARFAIRHPVAFRTKVRTTLTCVRWAKYLLPILRDLEKLKDGVWDLIKKHQQRRKARIVQDAARIISNTLEASDRRARAAILIQTHWRGTQQRKYYRALRFLRGGEEVVAALKLQMHFRSWLERARARLKRKRAELFLLQEMEKRMIEGEKGVHISTSQRRRMYELSDELRAAAKRRRQKRMLLRPNTHFALIWKFMWILCLLVEIATYVMNPRFEQYQKEHYSTQEVNLFSYLRAKAMPSLPHEWDECAFRSNFEPPWYCHELLVSLQVYFMKAMEFAVIETLAFVSVVFFLDVFVAFFTGVIDPVTGALVPKPFFKRWILGVLVQLLVNPRMLEISAAIQAFTLHLMKEVGALRTVRWSMAIVIPAFGYLKHEFEMRVWSKVVKEENAKVHLPS